MDFVPPTGMKCSLRLEETLRKQLIETCDSLFCFWCFHNIFDFGWLCFTIYPKIVRCRKSGTNAPHPHGGPGQEGHGPLPRAAGSFLPPTDGNSLFDSMASGMRLVVSCISSFLILSLLLFMVHRLRQRRRERIESLIGANLHHFNLGRRIPGFDYGPDGFGTGLTPLHLSDDGEGGTFHFHDPPPPYTAYKYPDIDQPDDPPPPYEASIDPDGMFYDPADDDAFEPPETSLPTPGDGGSEASLSRCLEQPLRTSGASLADLEDSADSSSALLVPPDPAQSGSAPAAEALPGAGRHSRSSLNTMV
ncbi:PREDICTED: integral membrane protein DGCR2/IDD-like [Propithecus coquereli]|uniref:integral membrane protein DGCR2/IDD-like n=1 Tax=Propithecus coquereli TaxID=379532 RepID=UPI00063EFC85|nr:PREDICTED: integral membrane protein DGCR2/IDD-like [Propithecus coquereli]